MKTAFCNIAPQVWLAASTLSFLVIVFTAAWWRQLYTRNAGMIDPVWALSLGGVALIYAFFASGDTVTRWMVGLGGSIWAFRLGTHLWRRNAGKPEDARYRRLRETWGAKANSRMFWLFQLQVGVSMMLSLAFAMPAYRHDRPSVAWLLAACAVWLISVGGEALADRQLARFAAEPLNRGAVCQAGLWRYSRHPNYFFECLHWLAYPFLSHGVPFAWLTLIPPLLMAWLLIKVSGLPMLEQHLAATRPGYASYMRRTSALVPWPPRRR
ncbi:DUF1295 domain-containing protein [Trinickia soli]|uniref:Uncharacterized protein n=1 Tax=Trinickia soli TaxID=380675 RepID=A0A2N7W681_9BURK|nr:DUF1295 domain-containing protein [Trinickia soli]KAA0091142.1 DUF1295 domain-containing protein [Paraburkholderia sp. T12-10]PMS24911.1 hypothetical protein C0Z19_11295 [Trinickia soli]CAB3645728.1 hypothetical protein LMG24076_00613 [Trinickia soli]